MALSDIANKINSAVANSIVGRRFRLQGSGHRKARDNSFFLTEVRAGLATLYVKLMESLRARSTDFV